MYKDIVLAFVIWVILVVFFFRKDIILWYRGRHLRRRYRRIVDFLAGLIANVPDVGKIRKYPSHWVIVFRIEGKDYFLEYGFFLVFGGVLLDGATVDGDLPGVIVEALDGQLARAESVPGRRLQWDAKGRITL